MSLPRGLAGNWSAMALGELAGEPLIVAITAGGCLMVSSVEGEEIRGNIFDSLPAELRQPVNSLMLAETAVRSEKPPYTLEDAIRLKSPRVDRSQLVGFPAGVEGR